MTFKKKKFNFLVALILCLIIASIVSSIIFVPDISKNNSIHAEENFSSNEDNVQDDVILEDNNFSNNAAQTPAQPEIKPINMTFSNAWAAFNYANKKNSQLKSYVVFNQKEHAVANVLGIPIEVDAGAKRIIYNNIDEVFVETDVDTIFDIGNLGIDVSMFDSFVTLTYYDNENNHVFDETGWDNTITGYLEEAGITTYQIPYEISKETATIVGGLVNNPKSPYYEITMNLKPKAWQDYITGIKHVVNIDNDPEFESVTLKIKIDKKYGTFHSIESVEKFSFIYEYSGMAFKLNAVGQVSMKFNYLVDISKKVESFKERVENLKNK